MGTNYYAYKMLRTEDRDKLKSLIDEQRLDEVVEEIEHMDYNKIHIGKNSVGWQFLFNHNDKKYYDLSRNEIDKFLRGNDVELFDEYGRKVDVDHFWKIVDDSQDGMDDAEYIKIKKEGSKFMMSEPHYDFHENGLRFSRSTDFS